MRIFAVFLRNLNQDKAQEHLQAHIDYLSGLREQGVVLGNGRLLEGWGGIVLFRDEDLEAVRQLVERDPFVEHGVRSYELFEWDAKWSSSVTIR
ncbi:YciI family protein [Paenibacillus hodogayensis]|uniref:YciI family protein n=1 Tax=Paenibacillus hodogayensis TaxID=279208 RepID=A0ABV5VY31_9BACL